MNIWWSSVWKFQQLPVFTILLPPTQLEEAKENKEAEKEENNEEVFQMLDRKNKKSLRYKRSFFVRMVSDPKIYNPKIVRSLPGESWVPTVTGIDTYWRIKHLKSCHSPIVMREIVLLPWINLLFLFQPPTLDVTPRPKPWRKTFVSIPRPCK